jgi:hypothetical protein
MRPNQPGDLKGKRFRYWNAHQTQYLVNISFWRETKECVVLEVTYLHSSMKVFAEQGTHCLDCRSFVLDANVNNMLCEGTFKKRIVTDPSI